jgi:hypothetical protein
MKMAVKFPILFHPINSLTKLLGVRLRRRRPACGSKIIADAENQLKEWKRQYSIADFNGPITEVNSRSRAANISVLSEMIEFCIGRELNPVIVVLPVSKAMSSCLSFGFLENFTHAFIKEANKKNVPVLDYLHDATGFDSEFFFQSPLCLNQEGGCLFTRKVLCDIEAFEI